MKALFNETRKYAVPHVFVGARFLGSLDSLAKLHSAGALEGMLRQAGAL